MVGHKKKKGRGEKPPPNKQATSPAEKAGTQGGTGGTNRNAPTAARRHNTPNTNRNNGNAATPGGEGTQRKSGETRNARRRTETGNPTAGGTETPKDTGGGGTGTARNPKEAPGKEGTEGHKPPRRRRRSRRAGRQQHKRRGPGNEKGTPEERNDGKQRGSKHNKHPRKAENKHGKPNASKPAHGTLT